MIIKRKTDNDFYKFTMGNAIYHLFPNATAEYKFKCRSKGINLAKYADLIDKEISDYCKLSLQTIEYDFLKKLGFLTYPFLQYLKYHKSMKEYIKIDTKGDELLLRIKGPWVQTILDEVPVLAIISEIYMKEEYGDINDAINSGLKKFEEKTKDDLGIIFADFGTRRRYSLNLHGEIIKRLTEKYFNKNTKTKFTGTSNVGFAMDCNIKPIGTMAHEWLQAGQALTHPKYSQIFMLENWLNVYKGRLGIALTDVIGIDAFLSDFNASLAKAFDGVRHDSGDPYEFTGKMIDHYKKMGIEPKTKSIIYSDGLNFEKAKELKDSFNDKINCSFGIGTNLTNDVPNTNPLQIVLKMVSLNELPVAKISDTPGKGMCENEIYIKYLKSLFSLK